MEYTVEEKSFKFAIRIVNLYKYLAEEKKEYVLSKQLLKCGTSIGANITEAQQGQSRADFVSKLGIAQKEAYEADYWIRLLYATAFLSEKEYTSLIDDCREIKKMLTAIIRTTKSKKTTKTNNYQLSTDN